MWLTVGYELDREGMKTILKRLHWVSFASIVALLCSCVSHQPQVDAKSKTTIVIKSSPVAKILPAKEAAPAKEIVKDEQSSVSADIVGKPLQGGKFAKLKIGMSKERVEETIGAPDRQWQQYTGDSTPYYTGTDRWLIQYSFKKEGLLTFGQDHLLIRILVNRAE